MIKYTKLSKVHYINNDTLRITTEAHLKAPRVVYIPPYLPSYKDNNRSISGVSFINGQLYDVIARTEETNTLSFKNLRLSFRGTSTIISYYDFRTKKRYEVILDISGVYENVQGDLSYDFIMSYNGNTSQSNGLKIHPNSLQKIRDLEHRYCNSDVKQHFPLNYGFCNKDFKISYRDDILDGTCKVFLFGVWGIILRDDFSIDAIFLVNKCKTDIIDVFHFIWTSNPYIAKFVTMRNRKR